MVTEKMPPVGHETYHTAMVAPLTVKVAVAPEAVEMMVNALITS